MRHWKGLSIAAFVVIFLLPVVFSIISITLGVLKSIKDALANVFGPGLKYAEEEAKHCKENPGAIDCWIIGLTTLLAPLVIVLCKMVFPSVRNAQNKDAQAALETTAELSGERTGDVAAKGYREAVAKGEARIEMYETKSGQKASPEIRAYYMENAGFVVVLTNLKEATSSAPDQAAAKRAFDAAAQAGKAAQEARAADLKPDEKTNADPEPFPEHPGPE